MDLIGPINPSLYENKYILVLMDDYSRYNWTIFLKDKSETYTKFYNWYKQIHNIFEKEIKYIKTDNGTEFTSNNFKNFCREKGIIHLYSTPYTPQQNGRIERLNRVLINTATALLEDSQLSRKFWEDAVSTASFLYNRIPHKSIKNQTPFEILYEQPVDYSKLRTFGCKVVFIIPKQFRHKFENTALPGIFIGYPQNTNAYKIFDVTNNKVIIARVVEFFENSPANFYFNNIIKNINEEYINTRTNNTKINLNHYRNNTSTNTNNNSQLITDDKNDDTSSINSKNNLNNKTNNANQINKNTENNNNINDTKEKSQNKEISNENMNKSIHHNNEDIIETQNENINHQEFSIENQQNNEHTVESNLITTNKRKIYNYTKQKNKKIKTYPEYDENPLREPVSYDDIFNLVDKEEWLQAVDEELNNMNKQKVFEIIKNIPKGANIIMPKWIFKYKRNADGKIIKRKARLVAMGCTQEEGVDFQNTFSPTMKQDSLRILTAFAVQNDFNIKQLDITAAYLNAPLTENIYMEAPKGHPAHHKYILKLRKALYGLKQSGMEWNKKLNQVLTKLNFIRLQSDPCIYKKLNEHNKIVCLIGVYVDDILLIGKDYETHKIKNQIKKYFEIKDVGDVDFIIGIKFQKYHNGYILHQKRYTLNILDKFKKYNIFPSMNLKPSENEININTNKKFNPTIYRSAIGNLLYLAISTRPDILFAVSKAARRSQNPTVDDWNKVIKIFNYLKGNTNYGLYFTKDKTIKAYSDADYAGNKDSRRSTSGFMITIGNSPISWSSKLQHCVSTSTAESEYYSLSECALHLD